MARMYSRPADKLMRAIDVRGGMPRRRAGPAWGKVPAVSAPLPIDEVLGDLVAALRRSASAVLIAPPGAGKTTRVPPALLDAGLAGDRDVVVLEPRRLAARMAAQRVAEERGERVGETVGFEVRFDRAVGPRTRIRFVTEGVLTRQLVTDPGLARVGAVVIDEFHERHLQGDLALALLRRLQREARPELRIVVMSATMAPGPVSEFLGTCPVIQSAGRQYRVDVEYMTAADAGGSAGGNAGGNDRPLEKRVAGAVRQALRPDQNGGDVLVFLPGAAEIRAVMTACTAEGLTDLSQRADLLPLHGDLPAAEQDRAVRRGPRRKVVLATNVAESSITIDGVTWVIDSGLARVARHSQWSGISTLRVEPVSQASAAQRAGRAGRTAPGRCVRLYTRHDHDGRPAYDLPEVARADLAEVALWLHALGVRDLASFGWFEAPPDAALAAAGELLRRLGAIEAGGAVTALGRRMLRMPVHPRQARMLIEAEARGAAREGCTLAALVGERELRLERRASAAGLSGASSGAPGARPGRGQAQVSAASDLIEDLELFEDMRRTGLRPERIRAAGLDMAAVMAVDRARRQLERIAREGNPGREHGEHGPAPARAGSTKELDQALLIATLAGYPDRVARRRRPNSDEVVFASGGSAQLAPTSVVIEAPFLVAVDAREQGRGAMVHRASAVEPAWLLDLFLDRVEESDELVWNDERERVERVTRLAYDGLTLDEQRHVAGAQRDPVRSTEIAAVLAGAALAAGIERFCDRAELDSWRARVAFAARTQSAPGKDAMSVPGDADVAAALRALCAGCSSFEELRRRSLLEALRGQMPAETRALVERMAPPFVSLPSRRRVPVHYEPDRPPWIESRLQDFFGMTQGPSVANGRVPVTLHLLAPNQRAVQVTSDLAGFWTRHYPALRKQLMRSYPRHAWPEDPLRATPPSR
jgi:ATP-dependent helicase HrpB